MMDFSLWDENIRRDSAEIRDRGQKLAEAIAAVRGNGKVQGVSVEVDAGGDITDLQIAQGAMRWTSIQLTNALQDCHRKARADAKAKVDHLVTAADPRLRDQLQEARGTRRTPEPRQRPMTEAEIQAADDAYFERMNRKGWNQ
jgi:hypothetical protein